MLNRWFKIMFLCFAIMLVVAGTMSGTELFGGITLQWAFSEFELAALLFLSLIGYGVFQLVENASGTQVSAEGEQLNSVSEGKQKAS